MTTLKYAKVVLSGSTNGRAIEPNTGSPGTNIHTTGISSSIIDEIWLYARNSDSSLTVTLTIEFGGTTNPDDRILIQIPPDSGSRLIIPGIPLRGDGSTGTTMKAYVSYPRVNVYGYVNRISH